MPGHDNLAEIAKEAVKKVKGETVLDVGTGFGIVIDHVFSMTDCSVVSIDPEAWTFDELKERYRKEIENGRLRLLKMGIENLEFDERTFDTTLSISSLHHLKSPEEGLQKMEEVTSGRVIAADWNGASAGVLNKHSRESMELSENAVRSYFSRNSYTTVDKEYWYLGWRDL